MQMFRLVTRVYGFWWHSTLGANCFGYPIIVARGIKGMVTRT
ncbi:hypothetical protein Ccrd_001148 [Cynara cardunculus var. scolymus]|uniref:Uncharacterized protein n=1 Tax=Cynara cardunculus var. scolymus TaxID=59895 RepID=A0A103XTW3_CYNCS|nr:hypothetical protein Ccrd_001148 [Cynara cardunculus var. scolymus]